MFEEPYLLYEFMMPAAAPSHESTMPTASTSHELTMPATVTSYGSMTPAPATSHESTRGTFPNHEFTRMAPEPAHQSWMPVAAIPNYESSQDLHTQDNQGALEHQEQHELLPMDLRTEATRKARARERHITMSERCRQARLDKWKQWGQRRLIEMEQSLSSQDLHTQDNQEAFEHQEQSPVVLETDLVPRASERHIDRTERRRQARLDKWERWRQRRFIEMEQLSARCLPVREETRRRQNRDDDSDYNSE